MSKSVLISINPKWCELIASGKKTIEVRKTRPKLETPFKCYIYMTAGNASYPLKHKGELYTCHNNGGKTVIGEFVCNAIIPMSVEYSEPNNRLAQREFAFTCLTDKEIIDYLGNGKTGYGWHISNLVIYDEPLSLNWFLVEGDCDCMNCRKCGWFNPGNGYNVEDDCDLGYENIYRKKTLKPLFRPPQSWCYVEDLEE